MENQRISRFWAEQKKVEKMFEDDGLVIGIYVIDTNNQTCEINGDHALKKALYDASSQINFNWKSESKAAPTAPTALPSKEGSKPPGAKCWLPYLPPGGIANMSDKTLRMYWTQVMNAVLDDRKNLGYDSYT